VNKDDDDDDLIREVAKYECNYLLFIICVRCCIDNNRNVGDENIDDDDDHIIISDDDDDDDGEDDYDDDDDADVTETYVGLSYLVCCLSPPPYVIFQIKSKWRYLRTQTRPNTPKFWNNDVSHLIAVLLQLNRSRPPQ